jgi:AGCS family alanine or glycine:cation symporter
MDLNSLAIKISDLIWSWPLLAIFVGAGIVATVMLDFTQFRFFIKSWKLVLFPDKSEKEVVAGAQMTSFQAFINALGTSTGNGSIAGIGTAIYMGGPGAAFWILIAGIFAMILRFAEVFLSTYVIGKHTFGTAKGGPMVYLHLVPGGRFLPYVYCTLLFLYGLTSGNAMQANSIGLGFMTASNGMIQPVYVAIALTLFVLYVLMGGAQRILKISDRLVPFKVAVFIISSLIVLFYHHASILDALSLIWSSAFNTSAVGGAAVGFTIQQAMRSGFSRSLNANEAGLGVAGIFYGASGSKKPVEDSIMAMLGAFIGTYIVCFMVALCIIVSGVWDNGLSSAALTISAFNTVFGYYGGWVVTFCAASFGLGVMISFAFIVHECWLFLTGGRYGKVAYFIYGAVTFVGTLAKVDLIWNTNDIVNGLMLLINLYGIIWLLPVVRKSVINYMEKKTS